MKDRAPDPRPPRGRRRQSLHEDFHGMTGIDLNRAGTPLLEIVSEARRSSAEAVAYAARSCTRWCAGSTSATATCRKARSAATPTSRCAARARPEFGTRREIKNLNSFRFLQQAIDYEASGRSTLIEDGGRIQAGHRAVRPGHRRDAHDAQQGRRPRLPLLPGPRPARMISPGLDRARAGGDARALGDEGALHGRLGAVGLRRDHAHRRPGNRRRYFEANGAAAGAGFLKPAPTGSWATSPRA